MRLSDVLSRAPDMSEAQVDGFLGSRKIPWGQHKSAHVGKVALNFFCRKCEDSRTFMSGDRLSCLVAGDHEVSIDATLRCSVCQASIEAWFLVASDGDIYSAAPVVHLERYTENLRDSASRVKSGAGQFEDLLDRAQLAYECQLGAGAMVYLRKIFEAITLQVADVANIATVTSKNRRKPFRTLLEEVDEQRHIIPDKFSSNGYKLFSELSSVIHGSSTEKDALDKYLPCQQLILGIVEKVRNDEKMALAIDALGWDIDTVITGGEAAS